uniref:Uncharacterized protein n=1 Tax=Oryzias latipes TaxID=8090 RepID=A0A3P9LGM3_ORYLA
MFCIYLFYDFQTQMCYFIMLLGQIMFSKSHSEPLQLPKRKSFTVHKHYEHRNKEWRRVRQKRRKEKPTESELHCCITEAAWEIPKGSVLKDDCLRVVSPSMFKLSVLTFNCRL